MCRSPDQDAALRISNARRRLARSQGERECQRPDAAHEHQEADQQEYDAARTEYMETLGYKVIRFTNDDVRYNINAVVTAILEKIENILQTPSPLQGEGRDEGRTRRA